MFDLTFYVIIVIIIGMSRIVHVHHVDKDAFLKGNMEPDPDEVDLVFERSPTYAEVLKQVRIELNWMNPSDIIELGEDTMRAMVCTSVGSFCVSTWNYVGLHKRRP